MQVREYARLTTDVSASQSLDCGLVSAATFGWLQDIAAGWKSAKPVALIDGRRSLKLGSYVGYLESPAGETIEILPKTGLGVQNPQAERTLLQRMLLTALDVKPHKAEAAMLMRQQTPLHEWIFGQFLRELKMLASRGLRFDYERVEEEGRFIRGQLQLVHQQRQPPGKQHLFHIRHDIFSANRLENRLLRTALEWVRTLCKTSENWRLANELAHLLADIPIETNPAEKLYQWKSTKLLHSYDAVHPWCTLVLERLNPNFQKGGHRGISLLFPMEQLFEKYVEASLRKTLTPGTRLIAQASSQYLLHHKPAGADIAGPLFQLKPDLLLHSQSGKQVLDSKWKLIDQLAAQGREKYSISQSDLYQLFAYGHKYQNGRGHMMLIYPKHSSFQEPLPPFYFSDELVIWAVPFCLESRVLIAGEWQDYFFSLSGRCFTHAHTGSGW